MKKLALLVLCLGLVPLSALAQSKHIKDANTKVTDAAAAAPAATTTNAAASTDATQAEPTGEEEKVEERAGATDASGDATTESGQKDAGTPAR